MPATPNLALRYPASTDPADVPLDLSKLATDVDTMVGVVSATPPASPVEGQLWTLVADATNGVVWTFRYRAAATLKWEFVGGPALYGYDATDSAITPVWPATGGLAPAITIPRAGTYQITYGHICFITGGAIANEYTTIIGPGVAATVVPPDVVTCDVANNFRQSFLVRQATFNASGTVQAAFGNQGNTVHSQHRAITVLPVCVS